MKTLRESYKRGIDYVEMRAPSVRGGHGGQNRASLLLTPDCFKRLCMRSRGRKAEDVRTYFIQLEALVLKYKDQLMAGMHAEIQRLERNQAPRAAGRAPRGGYIYVIRASDDRDGVYKVGRTVDLRRRLREHASARADDLEVLFTYRTHDVEAVEGCVKASVRRAQFRKYKEVYQIDLDVLKAIIQGCDGMQGLLKLDYRAPKVGRMTGGYFACVLHDDS